MGMLEYWGRADSGTADVGKLFSPLLHHSIIPVFPYNSP